MTGEKLESTDTQLGTEPWVREAQIKAEVARDNLVRTLDDPSASAQDILNAHAVRKHYQAQQEIRQTAVENTK